MNSKTTTPGLGDPYWYEWTVGQWYIIKMLDPHTGIESVTLQASAISGIDDVVVKRSDGSTLYVQVKHSRIRTPLSFGSLVATPTKNKPSLLSQLAEGWAKAPRSGARDVILFTNRGMSQRSSKAQTSTGQAYKRPPLAEFWESLVKQISTVEKLDQLSVKSEWDLALAEFLKQLEPIEGDSQRLEFLKSLDIEASQPSLPDIEEELVGTISTGLGVTRSQAGVLLERLDHALRRWATSSRYRETIAPEDVLRALSARPPSTLDDHRLPPPEPFFASRSSFLEQLTDALRSRLAPVVFLTGDPGSGKTSLVSALVNRRQALFLARFHAFRPLQPGDKDLPVDAGRTTTADALWGDLLSQVRERMAVDGHLGKYSVPIRNEFLSAHQKREHLIRICGELAHDISATVLIAIDGIDHAARSGDENSFIKTLPHPESIPDNVCILIAGQDPEAYRDRYPSWLVAQQQGLVEVRRVPLVEEEDVLSLVASIRPELSDSEAYAFARVLAHHASGSTLAAVFGAHESAGCADSNELKRKLEERKLHSNLGEYYGDIWSKAIRDLQADLPLVGDALAAVFSLSSRRVSGQLLADALDAGDIGALRWTSALDMLRPLVLKDDFGYRLLHNDVRVYLTARLRGNRPVVHDVARSLADLYTRDEQYVVEKHADGLHFLDMTGQHDRYVSEVTPGYVLEAWVARRPLSEIEEQCQRAVRLSVEQRDWSLFLLALRSGSTTAQLQRSLEVAEERGFTSFGDSERELPGPLSSEREVSNAADWTVELLQEVLRQARLLIAGGEAARARGMMRRWLSGLTPPELLQKLGEGAFDNRPGGGEKRIDPTFAELLRNWGELAFRLSLDVDRPKGDHPEAANSCVAHFTTGHLRAAASSGSAFDWVRALRQITRWYPQELISIGWELCRAKDLKRLGLLVRWFQKARASLDQEVLAQVGAFAVVSDTPVNGWLDEMNFEAARKWEDSSAFAPLASLGLLRGCLQPKATLSDVLAGAHDRCAHLGYTPRPAVQQFGTRLIAVAARLGQLIGSRTGQRESEYDPSAEIPFLLATPDHSEAAPGYHEVGADLLRLCLYLCSERGGDCNERALDALKGHVVEHPMSARSRAIWAHLAFAGEECLMQSWITEVLGDSGCAWALQGEYRWEEVNEFVSLARASGFDEIAATAEERMRWGAIGYSSHKDYSLTRPLEWYKAARALDSPTSVELGLDLLRVSRAISEFGDNRLSWEVEDEVAQAACAHGPAEIWRVARIESSGEPWLGLGTRPLFKGLSGLVQQGLLSEEEQIQLWCYTTGSNWWGEERDCSEIADVLRTIQTAAPQVDSELATLFPLEHAAPELQRRQHGVGGASADEFDPDRELEVAVSEPSTDLRDAVAMIETAVLDDPTQRQSDIKRAFAVCAERAERTPPGSRGQIVDRLLAALLQFDNRYPWHFDGTGRSVSALVPLLDDEGVWKIADWLLKREVLSGVSGWLATLFDDGSTLALSRWRSSLEVASREAKSLIEMHLLWIEGDGQLPEIPKPGSPSMEEAPSTWRQFFVFSLYEQLNTDSLVEASCVLRGLRGLAMTGGLLPYTKRLHSLHEDASLWFLTLLEKLALDDPRLVEEFQPIIEAAQRSQSAALWMQCWVLLRADERANGRPLQFPKRGRGSGHQSPAVLGNEKLLSTVTRDDGLVRTVAGNDAVHSRLNCLRAVTSESLGDLESEVARRCAQAPATGPPRRARRHRFADLVRERSQASRIADEVVLEALRSGRWSGVPMAQLAQAILPMDDPHVLLEPWPFDSDTGDWPADESLDELLSKDRRALLDTLRSKLASGLSDGELVVAGDITAFSRAHEVQLSVFHLVRRTGLLREAPRNRSTFNGRSFVYFESEAYHPDHGDPEWFSYSPGGLSHFLASTMAECPSSFWTDDLGWTPDPRAPLRWSHNGKPVARFEVLWGEPRSLSRERAYRLPKLQRWVCDSAALRDSMSQLGAAYVPRHELRVEENPESTSQ